MIEDLSNDQTIGVQIKYWHKYLPAPLSFRAEDSGEMRRTVHKEREEEPRNLPPLSYSIL